MSAHKFRRVCVALPAQLRQRGSRAADPRCVAPRADAACAWAQAGRDGAQPERRAGRLGPRHAHLGAHAAATRARMRMRRRAPAASRGAPRAEAGRAGPRRALAVHQARRGRRSGGCCGSCDRLVGAALVAGRHAVCARGADGVRGKGAAQRNPRRPRPYRPQRRICAWRDSTRPAARFPQEYTLKASAAPAAGDKSATFARARVDLARYAVAGGAGDAYVVDVPMALSRAAAAAAPDAPPPLLRLTVQATWLTRADDEDAWSDVSELSERALLALPRPSSAACTPI